jgi:hypothetical protein
MRTDGTTNAKETYTKPQSPNPSEEDKEARKESAQLVIPAHSGCKDDIVNEEINTYEEKLVPTEDGKACPHTPASPTSKTQMKAGNIEQTKRKRIVSPPQNPS